MEKLNKVFHCRIFKIVIISTAIFIYKQIRKVSAGFFSTVRFLKLGKCYPRTYNISESRNILFPKQIFLIKKIGIFIKAHVF